MSSLLKLAGVNVVLLHDFVKVAHVNAGYFSSLAKVSFAEFQTFGNCLALGVLCRLALGSGQSGG